MRAASYDAEQDAGMVSTDHANGHHGLGYQVVSHQFEDIDQQNESYIVGMWTFLVTEIMFFGAVFACYFLYRYYYHDAWIAAHHELNVPLGLTNTFVLLFSSFSMAMAVQAAQLQRRWSCINWMGIVIACAFVFMGIKYIEYSTKFEHHLFPGPNFHFVAEGGGAHEGAVPGHLPEQEGTHVASSGTAARASALQNENEEAGTLNTAELPSGGSMASASTPTPDGRLSSDLESQAELFFGFYFVMTGIHGLHIVIGILIISTLIGLKLFNSPIVADYMPIELTGLYWHFVDIVWIFLFPFVYLIGN